MGVEKLYRPANVSKSEAVAALFKARPDADLVSFVRVANVGGKIVPSAKGDLFEATLRVAGDFPPSKDEGGEAPSEESAPEEPKEEPSEDGPPSDDGAPDFGGGGEEGGDKPEKLSPEEETVSLLRQILHSLQGGAGPDAGMGDSDLSDPTALPDVGAPPAGGGLGGPSGPPLPPPVPHPHGGGGAGGGAFASVHPNFRTAATKHNEFTVERREANKTGPRALIAEVSALVPTHKVTKVNLDEFSGVATLTLKRR